MYTYIYIYILHIYTDTHTHVRRRLLPTQPLVKPAGSNVYFALTSYCSLHLALMLASLMFPSL